MTISQARLENHDASEPDVFFYPIDLHDKLSLNQYRFEQLNRKIKSYSDAIDDPKIKDELKPALSIELIELRTELTSVVNKQIETMRAQGVGEILVAAPKSLQVYSGLDRLLPDYGQTIVDAELESNMYVLALPVDVISAVHALPYFSGQGQIDPVINLRIQTSGDQPLAIYDVTQADHVRYEPSPGNWHSLPLNHIELKFESG